jgi:hypothetical protein
MLVTDIDHLQIAAPKGCKAEARRFFGDLLVLQEIEKPAPLRLRGGCWFPLVSLDTTSCRQGTQARQGVSAAGFRAQAVVARHLAQ